MGQENFENCAENGAWRMKTNKKIFHMAANTLKVEDWSVWGMCSEWTEQGLLKIFVNVSRYVEEKRKDQARVC